MSRNMDPRTSPSGGLARFFAGSYAWACAVSLGMAFVDISTGEFLITELGPDQPEQRVLTEFAQRSPKEVLYGDGLEGCRLLGEMSLAGAALTRLDEMAFLREASESLIKRHFGVKSLEGLGLADKPLAVSSAGAVLRYLESTQKRSLEFLSRPRYYSTSDKLVLDQTTLRNLEVLRNVRDGRQEGTLVEVLDHTLTPMGSRLLKSWLTEPLMDVAAIDRRLDAVEELVSDTLARNDIASSLKGARDLERLISKVMYGSANARDLLAVKDSLDAVPRVREVLSGARSELLKGLGSGMRDVGHVADLIGRSIAPDPPVALKEGGLIREGFDPALDALRNQAREGREWIASLEEKERERTGIKSLRLGFNNVFGYYIEVSKSNLHAVPPDYHRKQTIAGGERFVTPALKAHEERVLGADERILEREIEIFETLRAKTPGGERTAREARKEMRKTNNGVRGAIGLPGV